ncbi:hypothetical protein ACQP1P_10300 [Dactylosporangium sp. CA-052675]|uniref:hypothetical protein n=1 Tax=Dactylosporangium sp. CA-052675 TaxID=3239927 RepID=UPI003D8EC4AA
MASARPARSTYQAAYPSSTTSSNPSAAKVSAVARRPRRWVSGGTASVTSVTAARMAARPSTPKLAQATAVNTMAAAPRSRPPSTNSRFCTVRGAASGRRSNPPAGAGAATAEGVMARGVVAGGVVAGGVVVGGVVAGGVFSAGRGAAAATDAFTRAASRLRCDTAASYASTAEPKRARAASTCAYSSRVRALSRTTSAASGKGGRPQPPHPDSSPAGAPQNGHG